MSQQPWIDGAVTPPKVGDLVKARFKGSDYDSFYEVSVPSSFSDKHYTVLVTRDQLAASTFVPPEPPMPELVVCFCGGGRRPEPIFGLNQDWARLTCLSCLVSTPFSIDQCERVLLWNAIQSAIRAVKKEST